MEAIDFEALENGAARRTLQLAARLLEQQFNRDHSDYQGSSLPCACGRRARYVERRWKVFTVCRRTETGTCLLLLLGM